LLCYFINNYLFIIINSLNHTKYNIFLVLCVVYYINFLTYNYITVYFIVFFNYIFVLKKWSHIDLNLVYGLVNIHPLFFYLSLFILTINIFCKTNKLFYTKLLTILFISLCAMFFGGFWSTGNSSWGFFWLNDPIELVLLFIILLSLAYIHCSFLFKNYYIFLFLFLIIILYLMIFRVGFIKTRHNFFNVKVINNIFLINIIFFYFSKIKLNILYLFMLFYTNLIIFTLFFIYTIKKYFHLYCKKIIVQHILITSLFVVFLKSKENNISMFFFKTNTFNTHNIFFFFNNYNNFYNFFFFKNYYLTKFFLINLNVFSFKKLSFLFFVFVSYWNYILLMFFLISTLKIVPK